MKNTMITLAALAMVSVAHAATTITFGGGTAGVNTDTAKAYDVLGLTLDNSVTTTTSSTDINGVADGVAFTFKVRVTAFNAGGATDNLSFNSGGNQSLRLGNNGFTNDPANVEGWNIEIIDVVAVNAGDTVIFDGFTQAIATNFQANQGSRAADQWVVNGSAPLTAATFNFGSPTTGILETRNVVPSVTTNASGPNQTQSSIALASFSAQFTGTAAPEPSSTALLGLGGLALILRRRK